MGSRVRSIASIVLGGAAGVLLLAAPGRGQCLSDFLAGPAHPPSNRFGVALSLAGARACVSANLAAYVLQRGPSGWSIEQRLTSSLGSPSGNYGLSVSISGDTLLVGAPTEGLEVNGRVYAYERTGNGWIETQVIELDSSAGSFQQLGSALDHEREHALIGSVQNVRAYEQVGSTWMDRGVVVGSVSYNLGTGRPIAIDGDRALVAWGSYNPRVQVLDRGVAGWQQTALLEPSDAVGLNEFGWSVALEGERALVGAILDDEAGPDAGAAYVFEKQAAGWASTIKLLPGLPGSELYGADVALDRGRAWVAQRIGSSTPPAGAASLYAHDGGAWRLLDLQYADAGIASVASERGRALLGSPLDDTTHQNAGALLVHSFPTAFEPYGFCDTGVCANDDPDAGCANSTGAGAILRACGSASVAADDLVLTLGGVPARVPVLLLRGGSAAYAPFGDGNIVVGPGSVGLFRIRPGMADASGSYAAGPGLVSSTSGGASPILAGQTWNFQGWYRDRQGPCASGSNLSHGLRVTFAP